MWKSPTIVVQKAKIESAIHRQETSQKEVDDASESLCIWYDYDEIWKKQHDALTSMGSKNCFW